MSRKPPGRSFQEGLRDILEKFRRKDVNKYFEDPVDAQEVPQYYEHIKNPMCFSMMEKKIDSNQYSSVDEFKADFKLVCENCKYFNDRNTVYFKAAESLQRSGKTILANANLDGTETPTPSPRVKREITPRRVSPRIKKPSPYLKRESPRIHAEQPASQPFISSQPSPAGSSFISPTSSPYLYQSNPHRTSQQFMPSDEGSTFRTPSPHLKREWPELSSSPSVLLTSSSTSSSSLPSMEPPVAFGASYRSPAVHERKRDEDVNDDKKRKLSRGNSAIKRRDSDRQRLTTRQALGAGVAFDVAQPTTNMDLYHLWQMEQQLQRAARQPAATRTPQHCTPSYTRVGPVVYDRFRPLQDLPYVDKYVERTRRFVKGMPSIVQQLTEEKLNTVRMVGRAPEPEESGFTPSRPLLELVNDPEFKPVFHSEEPFGIPKNDLVALGSLADLGINLTVHTKLLAPPPKLEPIPESIPAKEPQQSLSSNALSSFQQGFRPQHSNPHSLRPQQSSYATQFSQPSSSQSQNQQYHQQLLLHQQQQQQQQQQQYQSRQQQPPQQYQLQHQYQQQQHSQQQQHYSFQQSQPNQLQLYPQQQQLSQQQQQPQQHYLQQQQQQQPSHNRFTLPLRGGVATQPQQRSGSSPLKLPFVNLRSHPSSSGLITLPLKPPSHYSTPMSSLADNPPQPPFR